MPRRCDVDSSSIIPENSCTSAYWTDPGDGGGRDGRKDGRHCTPVVVCQLCRRTAAERDTRPVVLPKTDGARHVFIKFLAVDTPPTVTIGHSSNAAARSLGPQYLPTSDILPRCTLIICVSSPACCLFAHFLCSLVGQPAMI